MIELMLQAERALTMGLVDQAERCYRQAVEVDPRNSIAVVGLARVALERGDEAEALRLARSALGIDPGNVAAGRLEERLEEILAHRGAAGALPADGTAQHRGASTGAGPTTASPTVPAASPARAPASPAAAPERPRPVAPNPPGAGAAGASSARPRRRGLLARLLGRR